uniref:Possible DNA polymerase III, epsilon subunit n=1 Tax=Paulinella chromatophora TaxID=39717 RepID=B1X404_PAUCH|nr:possible DNA polymerase III, epsilon subunit [Paulinella chromatophora]ACB42673.1 possible DNA polymerase III, epsilon subunit [Paulinella chromatophora]
MFSENQINQKIEVPRENNKRFINGTQSERLISNKSNYSRISTPKKQISCTENLTSKSTFSTRVEFPNTSEIIALPEKLLILDTETTSLSPTDGNCIEIGAILFHLRHRATLSQIAFLLPCENNPSYSLNGISAETTRLIYPWEAGLSYFLTLVESSDLIVAHNASFDRQWFGIDPLPIINKPWLCSMQDINWPVQRSLRSNPSIRDLALAYGVPVWSTHRALTDCLYMSQVFERCPELETLIQNGLEPRQIYKAQLSYQDRHLAREAGFHWNHPVKGAWTRRLSAKEVISLSFPVELIDSSL